jgi:HEAT repeat protein
MDREKPTQQDTRSTQELARLYVEDLKADGSGASLTVLHARGGAEELACAIRLSTSEHETERVAGADILAQLGLGQPTHLEASVSRLIDMLQDCSESVVSAACIALGHREDLRAIEPLCRLVTNTSAVVRHGVAFGLAPYASNPEVVEALTLLTADSDRDVRNWATFGVTHSDIDTPEVRNALKARTLDDDAEVRGEALMGLALREDKEAYELVRSELEGELQGAWAVEAATELADPRLRPVLEALRTRLTEVDRAFFNSTFAEAIKACTVRR